MDSSSPKRQSGLKFFKPKIVLWKGKNKASSKEHDVGGRATNPGAPSDGIPDGNPEDRGDISASHSLIMTEDLSGSMRQIENILRSMHTLALSIDYHSYACSDMAHQMRLLSDTVGEPNDGPSNFHLGTKRDSFMSPPSDETSLVHARCAAHSAAFWEKQSAIQESVRLSVTNLYQRINEDAKKLFEFQAREDRKVRKFLSDLEMGAFKSQPTNDSDPGAYDIVAEQISRIKSEVMYSWSCKREANFSSLKDDLVRSFAVGTTLVGSRALRKALKTFGPFQEMVHLLPDSLREDLDSTSSDTDDNFRDSSSPAHPVEDADTLREKAANAMAEKIAYARQRAASTPGYVRFHASHNDFSPNTGGRVSLRDRSRFRMRDPSQEDIYGSATQQRTPRRPPNGQNDILAFRAAISVDEDRIFSRLLTSVGALKTAHGVAKELEVKRIQRELVSLANSARESSYKASETFLSKFMGTDPTSYHSIDLRSKLLKRLSTATDRRPPSSLAVEVSSVDLPRSAIVHLGPEQMDEATVRRMLKEAETNMGIGTTGGIFGINTIRNCLAPSFKRRQVQVLVESACRKDCFDDASDHACAKPHRRRASMVSLEGGSILKRTGKFVRQNDGKFHITEPRMNNSKWKPGNNYLPPRTEFEIALDELYSSKATHSPPENHERPTEQLKDQILASIYGYQDRETRSRAKAQYLAKDKESDIKRIEALWCQDECPPPGRD